MEDLIVEKRKEIISEVINKLSHDRPDLYYADSSLISLLVREKIHSGILSTERFDLVKELSVDDILILLSYHSNCC